MYILVQLLNAPLLIEVTEGGIINFTRDEQLSKHFSLIVSVLLGSVTENNALQPEKHEFPILFTLDGIIIDVIPELSWNSS